VLKRNGENLKQMSKEKDAAWREMMSRRDEESKKYLYDSWIVDLEEETDDSIQQGIEDHLQDQADAFISSQQENNHWD